jgi:hypothetical protein
MKNPARRFAFKLALCLGKTVGELERSISSVELSEWMAWDQLDKLPDPWWQMGKICAVIAEILTGKAASPEDFIPRARPKRKIMSPEAAMATMRGAEAVLKAKS